ncbi:MAG: NADH-ubiquinone oxidoreductase-F iron-sulfur binding region domain-containing protein [Nitrospinota bacterium]
MGLELSKPSIYIGMGTCGLAAGALAVKKAVEEHASSNGLDIDIVETACVGICFAEPLLDIHLPGKSRVVYKNVKPTDVSNIVGQHFSEKLVSKKVFAQWKNGEPLYDGIPVWEDVELNKKQVRFVLANCGIIDPDSLDDYERGGGYSSLRKILLDDGATSKLSPAEVVKVVEDAKLRGRGGGGFDTGWKWSECAKYDADEKFILCNADEGDPGAFMDRALLEGDPHSVIEGMIIGGYAIGATSGFIYCRAEYPIAVQRLSKSLADARDRGYLGDNILGSGYSLDITVKEGAGAFVCGESTALQYSIEGKRGMPRPRPPQSVEAGLWNKPTLLNNVETFSNVPKIFQVGIDKYLSLGSEKSGGTKIFALSGAVKNAGLIEVPIGMTLREVIYDVGGGIPRKRKFKSVAIGGPSGGCLPDSCLDYEVDFETLVEAGAMMGSGSMVVCDDTTCMVELSRFFMEFCADESCGKCTPCRVGNSVMLDILTRITEGKGELSDLDLLEEYGEYIMSMSLCGLGKSSPAPALSALRFYRDEFEDHVLNKRCKTSSCIALRVYEVVPEACVGCGACIKPCPTGAIMGKNKEIVYLNKELCIECGVCYDKCNFSAID